MLCFFFALCCLLAHMVPAAAVLTQVRIRLCRVVRLPSSNGSQEDGHEGCCQTRQAPDHKGQAYGRRAGEASSPQEPGQHGHASKERARQALEGSEGRDRCLRQGAGGLAGESRVLRQVHHPGPLRPGEVRHAGELHERQDVQLVAAAREKHSQRLLDHGRLQRRLGVQVRDCQGGGVA